MHENSMPIFNHFGISAGIDGMIQYFHWEKRDDFHRVGEIDGENYGCDPTKPIIYRNIGLKEKLLTGEIDFGFIWDPDAIPTASASDSMWASTAKVACRLPKPRKEPLYGLFV